MKGMNYADLAKVPDTLQSTLEDAAASGAHRAWVFKQKTNPCLKQE